MTNPHAVAATFHSLAVFDILLASVGDLDRRTAVRRLDDGDHTEQRTAEDPVQNGPDEVVRRRIRQRSRLNRKRR